MEMWLFLLFILNVGDYVHTEYNLQYQFYPVSNGSVQLKVRAPNDAHIALTIGPQVTDPMIEIFIGGWGNSKSVIRRNRTKPEKVELDTPGILNGSEYRGFWIRWDRGIISARNEGEPYPFLSWSDPEPFPIGYVGVYTGWGANSSWKIEVPPSMNLTNRIAAPLFHPEDTRDTRRPAGVWVDAVGGQVPRRAVVGGYEISGELLYVARAQHEGSLVPGKLAPSHRCAYVPWGGKEHRKLTYQVLVGGPYNWVRSNGSNIPHNAFPGGISENGEPLFIGRVHYEGSLTTGKVQPSQGVCYIPLGGQELSFRFYEILLPQIAAPPSKPEDTRPTGVWVDAVGGQVPRRAVVGGHDSSGELLYVARAEHEGSMVPGKLAPSHGCAYVSWGGKEHRKLSYQVLVGGPNNWVRAAGFNIPLNAFPGGESENGETLFIGRVYHDGSLTTGKVQRSQGVCYIPFGGQELSFHYYEILLP